MEARWDDHRCRTRSPGSSSRRDERKKVQGRKGAATAGGKVQRQKNRARKRGERGRQPPAQEQDQPAAQELGQHCRQRGAAGACARRRAATGGKSTAAARPGKKEM